MRLEWFGDQIAAKASAASVLGVDATMAACVQDAKANHAQDAHAAGRWQSQTGTLEGSLRIDEFASAVGVLSAAARAGGTVSGTWGSADVRYALYQEIGTSTEGPTAEERAAAGLLGQIAPPIGPRMRARPYLRPASDLQYPLLRSRIRAFFQAG